MPWIKIIDENNADGELKEAYDKVLKERGKISNIMRCQSLDPNSMLAHLDLYISVMFGKSGLSREQREIIGVVVSAINQCQYCVSHHAIALNKYWKNEEKVLELARRYNDFELDEKNRAMINYAIKLTNSPELMNESDIEKLWHAGFSDDEILNINMVTGYFSFVNRLVLGLGVEVSKEEVKGYKY